mgnify:CR=1 FL=1
MDGEAGRAADEGVSIRGCKLMRVSRGSLRKSRFPVASFPFRRVYGMDLSQFCILGGWVFFWVGTTIACGSLILRRKHAAHCPSCRYSFAGAALVPRNIPRCPECGKVAATVRALYRRPVRSRWVGLGFGIILVSHMLFSAARVPRAGWMGLAPTWALAAILPWDSPAIDADKWELGQNELRERHKAGQLPAFHAAVWALRTRAEYWSQASALERVATSGESTRCFASYSLGDASRRLDLVRIITGIMNAEDWQDNGGMLSHAEIVDSGRLMVRAPRPVLEVISRLLAIIDRGTVLENPTHPTNPTQQSAIVDFAHMAPSPAAIFPPTPDSFDVNDVAAARSTSRRLAGCTVSLEAGQGSPRAILKAISEQAGVTIAVDEVQLQAQLASSGGSFQLLNIASPLVVAQRNAPELLDRIAVYLSTSTSKVVWAVSGDGVAIHSDAANPVELSALVLYAMKDLTAPTLDEVIKCSYTGGRNCIGSPEPRDCDYDNNIGYAKALQERTDLITQLLSENVSPDEWHVNGGDRIACISVHNDLLIAAPIRRHEQIRSFLAMLRADHRALWRRE